MRLELKMNSIVSCFIGFCLGLAEFGIAVIGCCTGYYLYKLAKQIEQDDLVNLYNWFQWLQGSEKKQDEQDK